MVGRRYDCRVHRLMFQNLSEISIPLGSSIRHAEGFLKTGFVHIAGGDGLDTLFGESLLPDLSAPIADSDDPD